MLITEHTQNITVKKRNKVIMLTFSDNVKRVQNMVLFFVSNTKNVGITKLCKLLNFADAECYIKTGFTISELEYRAKERGPVPMQVWAELQTRMPQNTIKLGLKSVIKRETGHSSKAQQDEKYFVAKTKKNFDPSVFSKKEFEIMQTIARKYKDTPGAQMSEESHHPGKPWEDAWKNGDGDGDVIDFDCHIEAFSNTDDIDRRRIAQKSVHGGKLFVEAL